MNEGLIYECDKITSSDIFLGECLFITVDKLLEFINKLWKHIKK